MWEFFVGWVADTAAFTAHDTWTTVRMLTIIGWGAVKWIRYSRSCRTRCRPLFLAPRKPVGISVRSVRILARGLDGITTVPVLAAPCVVFVSLYAIKLSEFCGPQLTPLNEAKLGCNGYVLANRNFSACSGTCRRGWRRFTIPLGLPTC